MRVVSDICKSVGVPVPSFELQQGEHEDGEIDEEIDEAEEL